MTTASHVEHVSMSAPQELSQRATSILSTLMSALSAAHALTFARQRLSAFLKGTCWFKWSNNGLSLGQSFFISFIKNPHSFYNFSFFFGVIFGVCNHALWNSEVYTYHCINSAITSVPWSDKKKATLWRAADDYFCYESAKCCLLVEFAVEFAVEGTVNGVDLFVE